MADELSREIERRVEELGYELVELERAGNQARPILRVYVDRPDAEPGKPGITLDECARVSRALEERLDGRPDLSDRYVLEVSSPGVERPLVRPRDWRRFAGQEVALKGRAALAGRARRLQGTLLGLSGEESDAAAARLKLEDGTEVEVPLGEVERAHLVFRWETKGRP
jgi:ribosome maturation factor RimP